MMSEALAAFHQASEAYYAADKAIERIDILEGIVVGLLRLNGHSLRDICQALSWPETQQNFDRIRQMADKYE